ncbi:MAG: DUF5597 domain-containing protein [Spirochaetales bacterium]|nr:DUF5597 domain-containing protein [Spirochaetales bacterium]
MIQLKNNNGIFQLHNSKKSFLILGGELHNSSASNPEYMERIWPRLKEMNLNTLLVPVYWEILEPEQGKFDFSLFDTVLENARRYTINLVLLWFGSWKNSMSCYAPAWIKENQETYPRARRKNGVPMEILSAFSQKNRETDARAFAALMHHLYTVDHREETVLMVQVENEIAMVEQARDYSSAANKAYRDQVPQEVMEYLNHRRKTLHPGLVQLWAVSGRRTSGSWEEIFGPGPEGEEIFTAWYFARYVNSVAQAGKKEYPLPMFTNAALNRPGLKPGEYPSGGPLPHLLDIWRAGAPDLDFFAPDIYFPDFFAWCEKYHTDENPLFIPEATLDPASGVNALYSIGKHSALGFSPFAIESADTETTAQLAGYYEILHQLTPLILANQGTGRMTAFRLDTDTPTTVFPAGDFICRCGHAYTLPWSPFKDNTRLPPASALLIALSSREFIVAGSGVYITFESRHKGEQAGILSIEEGKFRDGHWTGGRRMNGDESHQGRHLHLESGTFGIQRIKLYIYK